MKDRAATVCGHNHNLNCGLHNLFVMTIFGKVQEIVARIGQRLNRRTFCGIIVFDNGTDQRITQLRNLTADSIVKNSNRSGNVLIGDASKSRCQTAN